MQHAALKAYERSLLLDRPLAATSQHGDALTFDVRRWLSSADAVDATVIQRCRGPVLDIGCGPGRMVQALTSHGVFALGVDIAEAAVRLTRDRGVPALRRSVFDRAPGEGRWPTALLMDGNVGIGGDPRRLLRRVRQLLTPDGRLIAEVDPAPEADRQLRLRFTSDVPETNAWFDWAVIGVDRTRALARDTGFAVSETWTSGQRAFAVLERV
jgi:SAM-dependent methyltransferase